MRFRINANSCKNAMGTMFLLATAFFVCSTFISMRSVFADPVVSSNTLPQRNNRQSPRATTNNTTATTARTTTSRASVANATTASRAAVSRGTNTNRTVSSRGTTATRATNTAGATTRGVTSRGTTATRTTANNRAVRARSGTTTQSRVSATGSIMSGTRATTTSYSYLASKLYTGSYSDIIDSSTGLISADAYSNCMESYYTCMDEICTARSDTKGRCSCAGRATSFLSAEDQLEAANEELIKLSGQLSLLIATKGKGDDLASAFSLTDAEKVMNCVSWKDLVSQYGSSYNTTEVKNWCNSHGFYSSAECKQPDYCSSTGNSFGFDIKDIDGSSSDILAQLQAWADAKDLAKQYQADDDNLVSKYNNLSSYVNSLASVTSTTDTGTASLDSLANKWGYKLFEYAHNNVCGRVLDSCFNGIYEACGTPVTVTDSDGKSHSRCANGAATNCPYNYNSYISVTTSGDNQGDVKLNERSTSASTTASASCFGYTTTSTVSTTRTSTTTSSSDPYATLRGPVADARRSIMQKYLLDANAACDAYGTSLSQTAQNINYQKIAAEQALQQKRLEFKQEAESERVSNATAAINNFNECISEIWDCYDEYEDEDNWTTARIKAYCSQSSQVPHCYETMICSPLQSQFTAVVDLPDDTSCTFSTEYSDNTCRNVVTISEILYGTGASLESNDKEADIIGALGGSNSAKSLSSAKIREKCLNDTVGIKDEDDWSLRNWKKTTNYSIKYYDGNTELTGLVPSTYNSGEELPKTVSVSPTPTKSGYVFNSWCTDVELQNCSSTITIKKGATGQKAFYAKWTAN